MGGKWVEKRAESLDQISSAIFMWKIETVCFSLVCRVFELFPFHPLPDSLYNRYSHTSHNHKNSPSLFTFSCLPLSIFSHFFFPFFWYACASCLVRRKAKRKLGLECHKRLIAFTSPAFATHKFDCNQWNVDVLCVSFERWWREGKKRWRDEGKFLSESLNSKWINKKISFIKQKLVLIGNKKFLWVCRRRWLAFPYSSLFSLRCSNSTHFHGRGSFFTLSFLSPLFLLRIIYTTLLMIFIDLFF